MISDNQGPNLSSIITNNNIESLKTTSNNFFKGFKKYRHSSLGG